MTVFKVGDKTNNTSEITMGVTQGSSLSPALFNVYMDAAIQQLKEARRTLGHIHGAKTEDCMITLFAGDIKIQIATREGMENVLGEASRWTTTKGMNRSAKK